MRNHKKSINCRLILLVILLSGCGTDTKEQPLQNARFIPQRSADDGANQTNYISADIIDSTGPAFSPEEDKIIIIDQEAFNYFANLIKEKTLVDLHNAPHSPLTITGQSYTAIIDGIFYSIEFESLRMAANKKGLVFDVIAKNIDFDLQKILVKKDMAGLPLESNCVGSDITLAFISPASIKANIFLEVVDKKIVASLKGLSFINNDELSVEGPSKCSGAPVISDVIAYLLHGELEKSYPTLENAILEKAREYVPMFQKFLDDLVVDLLKYNVYPKNIKFEKDKMIITLTKGYR